MKNINTQKIEDHLKKLLNIQYPRTLEFEEPYSCRGGRYPAGIFLEYDYSDPSLFPTLIRFLKENGLLESEDILLPKETRSSANIIFRTEKAAERFKELLKKTEKLDFSDKKLPVFMDLVKAFEEQISPYGLSVYKNNDFFEHIICQLAGVPNPTKASYSGSFKDLHSKSQAFLIYLDLGKEDIAKFVDFYNKQYGNGKIIAKYMPQYSQDTLEAIYLDLEILIEKILPGDFKELVNKTLSDEKMRQKYLPTPTIPVQETQETVSKKESSKTDFSYKDNPSFTQFPSPTHKPSTTPEEPRQEINLSNKNI